MPKIRRLPAELANQIAAGEVVERPASVVKELVENALDAGARRIVVTTEYGGKRLIRVEDDGEGMEPEDARLALERHATSKIRTSDDLAAIATLGFRGEALPSIASVSHLLLRTRARGALSGTEIRVHGGVIASVVEAGAPEGTRVDVEDLFFNLPARRKFLKSDQAESAQISRVLTQLALGAPQVGFTLVSAGRRVLECPPARDRRERLFQIYGDPGDLLEVSRETAGIRVTGFIAPLAETGPRRGPQNVFINDRLVRDRTIAHAIAEAYSVASIKERSPEVHLFIEMPFDALDVNVHPSKAEVRFREQSLVHQVIWRALADALGRGPAPALALSAPPLQVRPPAGETLPIPGVLAGGVFPSRWRMPDAAGGGWTPSAAPSGQPTPSPETSAEPAPTAGTPVTVPGELGPLIPLGQFRDTYIIAVDQEGIAIIDQHVAHERVLYERTLERLTAGRLESQRLLTPLLVEIPPAGRQVLVTRADVLERLGFEVEEFGGEAVKVGAVPALLGAELAAATLRALADDLEGLDRGSPAEAALKQMAATIACHAAVKANYPLTYEKMAHILNELRATSYSTICPHGRPVMLRLTRRELEKNFQRI
ncbi:MAG TPA: DNA mismatch repair endonuclease MutL [Vicinamibacterales bacterium]